MPAEANTHESRLRMPVDAPVGNLDGLDQMLAKLSQL
jgi:hypothetical protein